MKRTRYRKISDTVWTVLLWGFIILQPVAFLGDIVNPDVEADTIRLVAAMFAWMILKRHRMDIALMNAFGISSENLGEFMLKHAKTKV